MITKEKILEAAKTTAKNLPKKGTKIAGWKITKITYKTPTVVDVSIEGRNHELYIVSYDTVDGSWFSEFHYKGKNIELLGKTIDSVLNKLNNTISY